MASSAEPSVYLVASGDLRPSANRVVLARPGGDGGEPRRGPRRPRRRASSGRTPSIPAAGHGFLDSQRAGMDVFARIPKHAPVVVAEAVWQYSHHVLAGPARRTAAPILTVANWSGQWPGPGGHAQPQRLRSPRPACRYSTLWSETFDDAVLRGRPSHLARQPATSSHDLTHVRALDAAALARKTPPRWAGETARTLRERQAILGVFDEGCMGMFNAIIADDLLNPLGVFKERLSQSALYARQPTQVGDDEAARRAATG